jgi:two-component system OmpR family sensor kinase
MSSNPRPETRRRGPRTLRARLLVAVIALLAIVCLVIGVVTELFLHHFLVNQLDAQLRTTASAPEHPGGPRSGGAGGLPLGCDGSSAPDRVPFFGLPLGSITGIIVSGKVVANEVSTNCLQPLADMDTAGINPDGPLGVPYTAQVGSLGDFRLIAERNGNDAIAITGLSLSAVDDTITSLGWILGGVAAVALVAAAVAGAVIVRRTLRPLRRVADTASRVAELELDRGDVALSVRVPEEDTDPGTEVGQVGAALNGMLGHVAAALAARQASEMRVRQFVADASHELRTPLAAIRGYAELTRRSDDDVPPRVAHAMRRVESESARMTTLVNDLLLLARLDSGRPLESDSVDLSRLVVDAVSDAHIAGPDHAWRLDLPPDPVLVTGDTQRLHQALANLLSNARTHTPSGTTVTTGLRANGDGRVVLTVTDDGQGIPPELLPEVFERFARGDTSRSRNAGSTGLGLAIVAAVVHAHGGTVAVRSQPGETVFTVELSRHSTGTAAPQP